MNFLLAFQVSGESSMSVELCRQVTPRVWLIISTRARLSDALIAHRHQRTSTKQQDNCQTVGGECR